MKTAKEAIVRRAKIEKKGELKGLKMDAEVAVFLLAWWEVLLCFAELSRWYNFVRCDVRFGFCWSSA